MSTATATEMVHIYEVRYLMEIAGGGDLWRIHGKVENHPNVASGAMIMPSSPVEYDPETKRFKTISGRVYQIESFGELESKFVEQIQKDIAEKGYEVH